MKNKKIVWLVHGPNAIYVNMFEGLKKINPNLDLIMTANSNNKQYKYFKNKYFKLKLLQRKTLLNFLFFPCKILYWLKGQPNNDITTLYYFEGLEDFLRKEKPDLVIANLYYRPSTWQAARYCKKTNTPFILQTEIKQFPNSFILKLLIRISFILSKGLFNQAKLILPWTEDGVKFNKKYFSTNNKIKLLPAGINTDIMYPVEVKKWRNKKEVAILTVGRMVPFKRHIDLLKALKYIEEIDSKFNYRLTICGTGPLENKIKEQAKELNINVNFIKKVSYKDMHVLFSEHDFFILPSYNEAIGMVVPEAMACGTPCIISDTCGSKTYRTKLTGFVFKTFDHKDLAIKILMMSLLYKTFGKNAKKHILEHYSIKKIAKQFNELIFKLI